ncbi:MAG: AEC family transporter [Nocardioidaceae bacterium]|nr:AEC family transporter [Nocardioidaceae bacterium]
MSGVLHGFVTIGAIIATGFALAQLKVLDSAAQKLLGQLSFFVAGPALLFTTVADADVRELLSRNLVATVGAVLVVSAGYLLVARLLHRNLGETVIGALCTGYVNSANLGIPIAAYVLGDAALVAPILLLQLLVLQPLALAVLDVDQARRSASVLAVVRRTASNPISLMTLAGLVVALTHTRVPALVDDPLRLLGGMSIPGMLLAFGVSLRLDPLPRRGPDTQELGAIVALKLVGQPLAAYLIGRFGLGLDHDGLLDVTVLAALPTAQNIFVLAMRYDRRVTLARDAVFLSTVLSVPAIVAVAALLA